MKLTKYPSIDINKIICIDNIIYEMRYNYESIDITFRTMNPEYDVTISIVYRHEYEEINPNKFKINRVIIVHFNEHPDDIRIMNKDADESLKYISKIRDYCGEYFDTNLISVRLTSESNKEGRKIIDKIVNCINKIISFAAPL